MRNSRGIALGINAIVMIIIAILILVVGASFILGGFGSAGGSVLETVEEGKGQTSPVFDSLKEVRRGYTGQYACIVTSADATLDGNGNPAPTANDEGKDCGDFSLVASPGNPNNYAYHVVQGSGGFASKRYDSMAACGEARETMRYKDTSLATVSVTTSCSGALPSSPTPRWTNIGAASRPRCGCDEVEK